MKVRIDFLSWRLSSKLVAIIEQELSAMPTATGMVLSFRDPNYSPETGGFHRVEVAVAPDGSIQYVTDFAYYGSLPYCELVKEIDFDFSLGLFQHLGREFPIQAVRELFRLWESNFIAYYEMGVYTVSAEPF
ncbi:DUF2787 family protein [Geomonas paludis]|uniref:DUF2787 domain-containing protein n=1 Tax=Geomonas paludis TaxID=2740185 RepID=A0A6V8MSA5_9BACT|nr:DUF2787 family protein [Geomonas paludis]GFO62329.1 hypothetical protein GMPD_02480 [Geomonas paludis]